MKTSNLSILFLVQLIFTINNSYCAMLDLSSPYPQGKLVDITCKETDKYICYIAKYDCDSQVYCTYNKENKSINCMVSVLTVSANKTVNLEFVLSDDWFTHIESVYKGQLENKIEENAEESKDEVKKN